MKFIRVYPCLSVVLLSLLAPALAMGADFYVSQTGNDANAGSENAPFRTILHAVKQAGAGDTVHLVPGDQPWRESVALNTHPTWYHPGGEQGKPLTIDGHGSWITGAEPCPPEKWQETGHGVWTHHGMDYSAFLVIDGQLKSQVNDADAAEPGEVLYVGGGKPIWYYSQKGQPIPTIDIGQPDGASFTLDPKDWENAGKPGFVRYGGTQPVPAEIKRPTWVKIAGQESQLVAARQRLKPGQFNVFDKVLHYRPAEGKRPDALAIAAVIRANGVYMGGSTSHVVIRNFNVRHVWNDGYNIHGGCRAVAFYNCNAEDCGDEGFSSHSDCETLLDGAVYQRCDNGIFNVGRAVSVTRNVIIANCRSVGYGGDQQTRQQLENVILIDNPGQIMSPNLTGRNILVINTPDGPAGTALGLGGVCDLDRVTVVGAHRYRLMHLYNLEKAALARSRNEDAGTIHIRNNDPSILNICGSLFHRDTVVEWGAAQPFKTMKLADAAKDAALPFAGAGMIEQPMLAPLTRGERPTAIPDGPGCTSELVERALDFMSKKEADAQ